jgi:hypothetical protein
MRAAGFRCETEKRGIVVSSGKRPDIVIYGGGSNKDHTSEVWFDLRTCHPTCASNCKLAAVHPGHAARRGNELKDDAWAEVAAAQGSSFIPLTHEAFGMLGKPAVDFINTMAIKAGACPIERSAFVRVTNQRIYTSNMKAVANMLLANAPFAPGPRLLPLTMLAPVRRPLAAPIAGAAAAAQEETFATGPLGNTRQQSQPIWVSAFLDRATDVTPTAENTAATPSPDLPLRAPR